MFSFGIKDIIDILIVALLLYTLYKMMKESGTISIFTGVLAFVGVWIVVTQILDMRLIGSIMDKFMSVGLLILVILFQDEIKRFLVQLGSHKRWRFFFNFFLKHKDTGEKPYHAHRTCLYEYVQDKNRSPDSHRARSFTR